MAEAIFTLKIKDFTFSILALGPLEANALILQQNGLERAWIFDPGSDALAVQAFCQHRHLIPAAIWHTHGHFDHLGSSALLPSSLPGYLAQEDLNLYPQVERYAAMFNLPVKYDPQRIWQDLKDEAVFPWGGPSTAPSMRVLATPGHTPGGRCFYFADLGVLITGDTLFAGAVGRTDLPGGNWAQLQESLRRKILPLPDTTIILPGHGPQTTLAAEKNANPYLQDLI